MTLSALPKNIDTFTLPNIVRTEQEQQLYTISIFSLDKFQLIWLVDGFSM